jgi:type II secretory pathway pseudopilin PulG
MTRNRRDVTQRPRALRQRRTAGYTLIELSLSLGVMAVLGVAMASAVVLCARAVPRGGASTAEEATNLAARIAQQMAGELHYALDVTEAAPTAVTFTVADRDGDGAPERIRYAWSGRNGDPLTRQYNNNPADTAVADVKDFLLTYTRNAVTGTKTTTSAGTTPELLLAFFNTYPSGTVSDKTLTLSTLSWAAERFYIDPAVVPPGTRRVNFTRAKVWVKGGGALLGLTETVIVQLMSSGAGPGGYAPGGRSLGPATSLAAASLPTSYSWVEFPLSNTALTDPAQDVCLLLKGGLLGGTSVQYKFNNSGPSDSQMMTWSGDAGLTWSPTAGKLNQQDLRFYVYGTCTYDVTVKATVTDYYLTGAGVRLRLGTAGSNPVYTSVAVLEHPRVTGP